MTKDVTKDVTKVKTRSVRLYDPVAKMAAGIPNFNYFVNKLLGEQFGINPQVIEAYRRGSDE